MGTRDRVEKLRTVRKYGHRKVGVGWRVASRLS